ncbi:hypothetical protein ACJX0J_012435, partial [Zea mays]
VEKLCSIDLRSLHQSQGLIGGLEAFRAHYILDGQGPDMFNHFVAIAVEDKGRKPAGNNSQNQNKNTSGNIFYTQVDVTLEGNPVLMGTFIVAHHPAKVLFDTGASHTFISRTFAVNYDVPIQETHMGVIVKSPGGNIEGTGHRSDSRKRTIQIKTGMGESQKGL